MHRIATALLLSLGFAAASVTVANAQLYGYGYGVPSGSYQRTCNNAQMRGSVLTASCTNNSNQSVWSSLDVRNCSGDIGNNDGHLGCPTPNGYNSGGYGYNNGGYGSNNGGYNRGENDDDDDNGRGREHRHHHPNGNAYGYYNNGRGSRDGGYNNGGYGYGYGLPAGSYQQSCQNERMNGSTLYASCAAPNGSWINSSLNLNRCRQGNDVYNRNGYLGC